MGDKFKGWGALIVSGAVLGMLVWWLIEVSSRIGTAPTVVDGAVTIDSFQRSKDILLVVLPLATTAVGFWLGNQNSDKMEKEAKARTVEAQGERAAASLARERAEHAHHLMGDARADARVAADRLALLRGVLEQDPHGPPDVLGLELLAIVRAFEVVDRHSESQVADAPDEPTFVMEEDDSD